MMIRLLAAAILIASVFAPVHAQEKINQPDPATQSSIAANALPPYLITSAEHLIILFEADESAITSILPPGLKPAEGNIVGLNMYHAQHAVGLVPYTASYLWVNLAGFDSSDGTKGRWMVEGWYAPEPVPTVFKNQLGIPVQLGITRFERSGNRLHAILNSGNVDLIDAAIEVKDTNPISSNTVLKYPAWRKNVPAAASREPASDIVVNRIPITGELTPASVVSLEFHLQSSDAAKVLQPKRLLDAMYFKSTAFGIGFIDVNPPEMAARSVNAVQTPDMTSQSSNK
jgi:hypothetical protein